MSRIRGRRNMTDAERDQIRALFAKLDRTDANYLRVGLMFGRGRSTVSGLVARRRPLTRRLIADALASDNSPLNRHLKGAL